MRTDIATTGRVRGKDDVIAYHVRQSFRPGEITPEEANRLGVEFTKRFTKGNHAFIVCTHIDKAHVHNHIIWSSVNLDCDRKFRNFWGSTKAVRRLSDTICIENGLSIIQRYKELLLDDTQDREAVLVDFIYWANRMNMWVDLLIPWEDVTELMRRPNTVLTQY